MQGRITGWELVTLWKASGLGTDTSWVSLAPR